MQILNVWVDYKFKYIYTVSTGGKPYSFYITSSQY